MRNILLGLLVVAELAHANRRGQEDDESYQSKPYESYSIWESGEIHDKLHEWQDNYPDFFHLTTSQEKYGLPAAGDEEDCPFYAKKGCPNYIATIQDFITHPEGSDSSEHLPEVFWSGCLHGNERVGPTSVMHATFLLLQAASCEATPRNNQEIALAKRCRKELKEKGIDDYQRKWLARLLSTRRIVMTSTTNALGYYRNERTEEGIDPNRDFPYDVKDPKDCMQTIAGRTINEIYKEHLFQLALTFHAGTEVVGYEWGAPTWLEKLSPDNAAQASIGAAYSRYGGGWSSSKPYEYGTMNDLVYEVRGGMEDWSYAGSWDPDRVVRCEPSTFGGYGKEKTVYNNSTLRIFNMLIETSNTKEPHSHLGNSQDVLNRDTKGNGHISRNIRLALLAAELVEPYVSVFAVNQLKLSDDIVPMSHPKGSNCRGDKSVKIAKNVKEVVIEWTVGGAMTIDNTELWYAKWDDIKSDHINCLKQPNGTEGFEKGTVTEATSGTGFFSEAGAYPSRKPGQPYGPIFTGVLNIPEGARALDEFVVIVSARVDSDWKNFPKKEFDPKIPPQSHIVNARTDPEWHHESAGKYVQGRLSWFSKPLTIVIGDFEDGIENESGQLVDTIESPRFGADTSGPTEKELIAGLLCLALALCYLSQRRNSNKGYILAEEDDDFVFDAKPYSDKDAEVELQSIP
eukprot:scaffold3084_cov144-Cylindrotheca_fusiformis.AAC.40